MSVTIKSSQINYKDPTTGNYVGLNSVAEKKLSELQADLEQTGQEILNDINSNDRGAELVDIRLKADGTTATSAGAAVRDQVNSLSNRISSESSARTTQANTLSSRLDLIEAGTTAADSELVDVRVKADGTTAASAGAAVREQITELKNDLTQVETDLMQVIEASGAKRYGVSGIGQAASALTRIYDSVGMVAQVGTDGDNSNVVNDFDNAEPFKRRKCVGEWHLVDGRAQFHINAYKGDADYAEDGSMGDYVAVECPRCFYYFKDGTLIISAHQYSGYRPFDIFCRNHDVNDTIPFYYLPAYPLVLNEDGHAVCLPGYDNEQGCYKELLDAARTYKNGELGNLVIIQPMAVNFYEWALFTVEFAEQHCQTVMQGCAGLRHNNDDRVTFVDSTHILTNNYYASRVAGQRICIIETDIDINNKNYLATHEVVSVTRCDENGQASSSGTHQLLEISDLGRAYFTYDITGATEYKIAARPYPTGACNNVSTPSGSPVSNTDSYHPMKYRWRENIYANQYKTIVDLFNKRVGTGDSDYILEHYLLVDPTGYEPSANSKPDATDLDTDKFVLLDIQTEHENYVNGYIKSKKYSEVYPDVWIPYETSGASASTYFADYAYLVSSNVVRSVRLGGSWSSGANDGLSYFNGYYAPSNSFAYFGADLCFAQ